MEDEDVPPQLIEEYAQTEVVRKALANVRYHADKMRDIRGSPERYDQIKSKLHTQGSFSPNKNISMYQTSPGQSPAKSFSLISKSPEKRQKDAELRGKIRRDVMSFEERHNMESSPLRESPTKKSSPDKEVDIDKWQPGADDIPITAQLTRAAKNRLAKRDDDIIEQEGKLREIEEMIANRKAEREAKAEELEKIMSPSKAKKKGKKGTKTSTAAPPNFYENTNEDEAPESPYKAVLREAAKEEADFYQKCQEELEDAKRGMLCISKSSITELKQQNAPPQLVKDVMGKVAGILGYD